MKTSSRRLNCLPKVSGLKAPTRDQVSVSPHGLESAPLLEGTRASLSDLPKHWIKAPAPSLGLLGSLGSLSAGATLNVSSFIIGTVQKIKKYGSPTMIASRNVQVPDSHKGSRKPYKKFQLNLRQHEEVFFVTLDSKRISDLEEGPRLEESFAQCLIKVKVESVVSVYVVPDPDRK